MTTESIRSNRPSLSFLAPAALLLASVATSGCGTELDSKIAHVSGRDVEVVEAGPPSGVTVVFEAGLGDDWTPWDDVASEVAADVRVFAYSRPGYGDSDSSSEPRDATHIVEDLRSLLAGRGFAPPYVLVGHSFGGVYMELFAKAYPEEVVGLVLVDTRHAGFTAACAEAMFRGCTIPDSAVRSLPRVERREIEAFTGASEELRAAGPFGAYPVRVLTATSHDFAPQVEALWQSLGRSLADEAADGEQIVFAGEGHYLQLDRPEDVTEVILGLVRAAEP